MCNKISTANNNAPVEEAPERVLVQLEEEQVVAQRGHTETNLTQVVQVLQGGAATELDTVVDAVGKQKLQCVMDRIHV